MSLPRNKKDQLLDQLARLGDALDRGAINAASHMLDSLPPQEVAHLLESSPPRMRQAIWQLVDVDDEGEILQCLSDDVQSDFLQAMQPNEIVALTEDMEADDIADILQQLPDRLIVEVLQSMDAQDRQRVEQVIQFDESSAGGLMSTDMITVRAPITLDVVLRFLRRHEELPHATDTLYVVNRRDEFIGLLPLARLLVSSPSATVREIMSTDITPIPVDMADHEVALLFERNDWISAPVVSAKGKLLGRITIDDVVDVIRDEADHSLLGMAGLSDDEDTFSSVKKTTPRRAIWLGINLITALLASSVVKLFDGTIEHVVALAVLMPIVASMGGVAGSQTLTVMIRGMALGQVNKHNSRWLLNREVTVSLLNGVMWAGIMAAVVYLIYHSMTLALIMGAAIVVNLLVSALVGTQLPIVLKILRIDPALAGSVILTTFTDCVGFFAFLGIATLVYM